MKIATLVLYLRIETKNRTLGGRKGTIASIEHFVLEPCNAKRRTTGIYVMKISYDSDEGS